MIVGLSVNYFVINIFVIINILYHQMKFCLYCCSTLHCWILYVVRSIGWHAATKAKKGVTKKGICKILKNMGKNIPLLIIVVIVLSMVSWSCGFHSRQSKKMVHRASISMRMVGTPKNRDNHEADIPINDRITAPYVRLLVPNDESGKSDEMIGIFPIEEALAKATEMETDLILINEKAEPPVCKLMEYGKYRFLVDRKQKEKFKNQSNLVVKELKMSPNIEQHDFDVRARAARKFIEDGEKVKVVAQMRGRQMVHTDIGVDLLKRFYASMEDIAKLEAEPALEGRSVSMLLTPKMKKK
jgi:translation initiation factor IF-3